MELRIIGGVFRGTKILFPDQLSHFRPTKNRVREAVISSLMADIPEAEVLELCGGSMIMSLELLSRGASHATAIERNSSQCAHLRKSIKNKELLSKLSIETKNVEVYIEECTNHYDIIFFDPPYYDNSLTTCLAKTLQLLTPCGVLVFESASDDAYAHKHIQELKGIEFKEKRYGKSYIHTIRKGL